MSNPDELLVALSAMVEREQSNQMSLTVVVAGAVITGRLAPESLWRERVSEVLKDSDRLGPFSDVVTAARTVPRPDPGGLPTHLHFHLARILQGTTGIPETGGMYRVAIDEVSGWTVGDLRYSDQGPEPRQTGDRTAGQAGDLNDWTRPGTSTRALHLGMKPMSAIWSASSRTVMVTSSSRQSPRSMRSFSRPGVATTTSAPPRSAPACLPIDIPPTTVAGRRPTERAYGVSASVTCWASSRVGTRTRASGCRGSARRPAVRASIARPKGEGLARAGAATAEHVTSGEGVRQGRRLDRERHADTLVGERGQQPGRHVEFGERLDGGQGGRDRLRRGELTLEGCRSAALALGAARTAGAVAAAVAEFPEPEAVPVRLRAYRSFVRTRFMRNLP
ncbi:hypothetical protein SALBM311S_06775 [Streptomyces alboniger]